MRSKIILLAAFLTICTVGFAQQPPNPSFENWTYAYSPTGWVGWEDILSKTTPIWTFKDSTAYTQGRYSVELISGPVPLHHQVFNGLISLGSGTLIGDTAPSFNGISFTYRPDTLSFDYQYSQPGGDTAAAYISLTATGGVNLLSHLGAKGLTITLKDTSGWAHVAYVLTPFYQSSATPDSLVLNFNASNTVNPVAGSTLLVDNVKFGYYTGARINATITATGYNVCPGDSVKLTANTGTNYTYQWNLGTIPISGATSSFYYATAAGSYTVTIDSASANATSLPTVITANCQATINATITPPSTTNICNGDSVLLSAGNGVNYTFQWNFNGNPIVGATSINYWAKAAGSYTVTVDSATAHGTSQAVVITANCGGSLTATITAINTNVCNGDSVLLSANTGTGYTYHWKLSGIPIAGATSSSYWAKTAGSYTVTIDSGLAVATSQPVIITANCGGGSITATIAPPSSTNVCNGDSILLTANTGTNYTYQWYRGVVAIAGATSNTYYVKTAGSYYVTIDSATASATSHTITITANCGSGSISATITPSGLNVCNGDSVLLTANTGTNYTYQWYNGVLAISGATSSTYYAKSAGSYTVTIDSLTITGTSPAVVITANCASDTLTATITPSGTNVCNGDSVLLTANAGTNYTYQWYQGLAPIAGATSITYYAKTAGAYTVVVDSGSSSTTSLPVNITANCGSGTITAIITAPNTNICNGDSVLLTANSGNSYSYTWNLNGTAIAGATAITYYAKTTGVFTVTIDSASATGTSPSVTITDTGCVNGIANVAGAAFMIYPNPATNLLNINSSENLAGFELQVYDLVGRLVISQVLTGTNNKVDVAKLANGAYIYRVIDKQNNILTQNKFSVIK